MKELDSIQKQMDNTNREIYILRNYQKEMIEIKSYIKAMKNVFDGVTSRLDTAKKIISDQQKLTKLNYKEKENEIKNRTLKQDWPISKAINVC